MTVITAAMARIVVIAETTIMTRARATSWELSDSALSPAVDRLCRCASDKFMTSTTPTRTSVLVAPEEAGERLDRLLARRVSELSRSRLKALIEAGTVE